MKPDPKAITRKLRSEAAAGAFPILDQLRERHADVADFDTVVDALVAARVQGWKDAELMLASAQKAQKRRSVMYRANGRGFEYLEADANGLVDVLAGHRAELRRMIRAARA